MDPTFKIQPVAAFYRLLAKNILYITGISAMLSGILFPLFSFSFRWIIGEKALMELSTLVWVEAGKTPDLKQQNELIQKFILEHPSVAPLFMVTALVTLLASVYAVYSITQYMKQDIFLHPRNWKMVLLPERSFVRLTVFVLLIAGMLLFLSGLIFVIMQAIPLAGLALLIMIGIILLRHVLVVPGMILADMDTIESVSYSRMHISIGRAFKILLFGSLLFFALSFLLSLLFYYPVQWANSAPFKMYVNFLLFFIQAGLTAVGMTALFLRYGEFEEVNIAE